MSLLALSRLLHKTSLSEHTSRHATLNLFGHLLGALWGAGISILLARLGGEELFGTYVFAASTASLVATITSFAIGILLIRQISRFPKRVADYLANGLIFGGTVSFFFGVAATWFVVMAMRVEASSALAAVIFALIVALSNQRGIVSSAFRGLGLYEKALFIETLSLIALFIALTLALLRWIHIIPFLLTYAAVELSLAFLSVWYASANKLFSSGWIPRKAIWKEIGVKGPQISFMAFGWVYNQRIGVMLLAPLSGTKDVALFGAGLTVYLGVTMFAYPVCIALFRRFSEAHHQSAKHEFSSSVLKLGAIGAFIAILIAFFSRPLVQIVFGDAFVHATIVLELLCAAIPLAVISKLTMFYLVARNAETHSITAVFLGSAVHTLVAIVLIPSHGIAGAAVALVMGELVIAAAGIYFVYGRLTSRIGAKGASPLP